MGIGLPSEEKNIMKKPVILCVDDEAMLLRALKQQLKRQFGSDYYIEIVDNGEEALSLVEELLEDNIELPLVLCDYLMPGMKGDELLKRIHAIAPDTLKILLTGQADAAAVGYAVNNAKLYRYIPKPWEETDFKLTVIEAIRSYFQQKQVALLSKELAERNRKLQQKNEFLGIAVHDLKTPLSAIQNYSDMLIQIEWPKEKVTDFAEQIFSTSQYMFELITNILDVNRIESGKMELSLTLIDIRPILQWLVSSYKERANAKGITLHFQSVEKKYYVMADETLMRQVYDNLISNAVKYSPHGKHIYVRLSQVEKHVRCEIQDEGPGLSDEDQEKLFHPFTRLMPKPTAGEHSTGLGLFIVKNLVETMGGKVWCESVLGQGATFIVEFPTAEMQGQCQLIKQEV
jgi:signal transduction histidine kinase